MDLRPKQKTSGIGDPLSKAFEFAATLAIFFVLGFALDRWLGTTPWFMLVLSAWAVIGQFLMLWYRYDATMRRHEAELRQAREAAAANDSRPIHDAIDAVEIEPASTALDHAALDHAALDHAALDHAAVDPATLDHGALDDAHRRTRRAGQTHPPVQRTTTEAGA